MTFKKFFDYGGHSWGWECISCKETIDQIQENRQQLQGSGDKNQESKAAFCGETLEGVRRETGR
jgi:hypothetical protein